MEEHEEKLQGLQVERELLRKTQTEIKLEMYNLGSQVKISKISFTKKAQNIAEGISGVTSK